MANSRVCPTLERLSSFLQDNQSRLNFEAVQVEFWVNAIQLRRVTTDEQNAFDNRDQDTGWLDQEYLRPLHQITQMTNVVIAKTKRGNELDEASKNPAPEQSLPDEIAEMNALNDQFKEHSEVVAARVTEAVSHLLSSNAEDGAATPDAHKETAKKTILNTLNAFAYKIAKRVIFAGRAIAATKEIVKTIGGIYGFLSTNVEKILAFTIRYSSELWEAFNFIFSLLGLLI